MRRIVGLLLLLAGCQSYVPFPVRVETDNRVVLEGPLKGQFSADLPAIKSSEPLEQVAIESLGGRADPQQAKVGIIDLDGLLLNTNFTGFYSNGENPVALFKEKLDRFASDDAVRAVVLRINSPGGSVAATDVMAKELQAFRERTGKPVVAAVLDLGCGGGYFLATLADAIVAQPSSLVGGVGVVLNLYNLREMMNQFNVLNQSVKAGEHIDMGTANTALTPEAKRLLQAMADEYHEHFRQVVRTRRQLGSQAVNLLDGRVLTARQAQEAGLVDQIGYLEDAVALARGYAKSPHAAAVMLRRPGDPALSPYAVSPNIPMQMLALGVPGLDRSKLPTFMYVWAPDPTLEKVSGK